MLCCLVQVLFVPLPPPDGRASILAALTRKTPLAPGTAEAADHLVRTERCDGFSGADMAALVREASVLALKECMALECSTSSTQLQQQQRSSAVPQTIAGAVTTASSTGVQPSSSQLLPNSVPGGTVLTSLLTSSSTDPAAVVPLVEIRHFEAALSRVSPSVSRKDQKVYESLRNKLRAARGRLNPAVASTAGPAPIDEADEEQQATEAVAASKITDMMAVAPVEGGAAAIATAGGGGAAVVEGDAAADMEGTDDAQEPEDPMND